LGFYVDRSSDGLGLGEETDMSEPQTFRDLIAWQRAIDLAPEIYKVIRLFPEIERFALSDQLRRAVISVSANIAEGQGRQHPKEFTHFLTIARGSLSEVESLLTVARRLEYISDTQLTELTSHILSVRRPLHGLIERFRGIPDPRRPRTPFRPLNLRSPGTRVADPT
jgi:four helix bundle protein